MSGRVGLELGPEVIRGIVASSWRDAPARTFEVPWNPSDPASAIDALRSEHPSPEALWIAVGLGFLHVARVQLPPTAPEAREQMVAIEPDRFFPSTERLQVALADGGDTAFAVNADWLEQVVRALEGWAPVARVEAAPLAIAASMGSGASGTWAVVAAHGEQGVIELRDGRVHAARRIAQNAGAPAAPALPDLKGTPGASRAAWGALLRDDAPVVGTLMPATRRAGAQRRRLRGIALAMLAAASGLTFLLFAADRSRERTLAALTREAERLTSQAQPAMGAQSRLALRDREAVIARGVLATRADPGAALAAISAVLPPDVVLLSARATGRAWQVDGTAGDAAALVRLLDADGRFGSVRSLAASSRFRDGRSTRESFSIAFDVR